MKLLIATLMALSANAFAAKTLLLTITNDNVKNEVSYFYVETDGNGDAVAFSQETFKSRKLDKSIHFNPEQAYSGVVLAEKKGRDVVILKSKNFSTHNGGNATLHYLYNGVTGSWNSTSFELGRNGDTWEATQNGRKITKLKFLVKKITFVGVVGIRSIKAY